MRNADHRTSVVIAKRFPSQVNRLFFLSSVRLSAKLAALYGFTATLPPNFLKTLICKSASQFSRNEHDVDFSRGHQRHATSPSNKPQCFLSIPWQFTKHNVAPCPSSLQRLTFRCCPGSSLPACRHCDDGITFCTSTEHHAVV